MSVRGAQGPRGAAAAIALALLVALPALVPLREAEAQASSDPWWGPSDRTKPTDGWAIRVPITVRNDFDYPLLNHTVAVDIDFGALLVKAGWTNQTAGATTGLRGFTLDADSLRVVQYVRGFNAGPLDGASTKPTPHRFYEAPFHAARHREFDPARNPAGTVLFVAEGALMPGETRSYHLYANPLEFRDTPPAAFKLAEQAPLDAYLWGSRGTVHYGYEPQQQGTTHKVLVRALHPGKTTVSLYLYTLGRFTLAPPGPAGANPLDVGLGASLTLFVPAATPFKVVATKPVVVAGHGILDTAGYSAEAQGYVPSSTGSYAGNDFDVYGFTGSASYVTLTRATPGTLTVTYGGANPQTATLSAANPTASIPIPGSAWTKIRATGGDILVSMHNPIPRGAVHTLQVPALTGGPTGTSYLAGLAPDGGFFRACSATKATVRVIDYVKPSLQAYPEGITDATPPAFLPGGATCGQYAASASTPPDLLEFVSTDETRYPVDDAPVPFSLVVGAGERAGGTPTRGPIGHFGGPGAVEFRVEGRIGLFGHYNDTRVFVTEERAKNGALTLFNRSAISIGADGFYALDPTTTPDATGRWLIRATKPIQVVSLEPAEFPYARYVPGRPPDASVTVGAAEFRGPLLELRSPDTDARQLFRSTGPGNPLPFRLDVMNLGRWIGGEGLPDDVEVRCEAPADWKVDGCDKALRLESGQTQRLNLLVTPPADDVNATKAVNVTARSKSTGVAATFRLLVYVEVKYGVGLWLDVEGGRKTVDPPIGVEPGATHRYSIVIKNTGSTPDSFALTADPPSPGWTQALLLDGAPVKTLALDGGESRVLTFEVTAPDAETAPQNVKSVSAQSLGSALAGDVVNTATRIRPKVSVKLDLDPQTQVTAPGETARFNVTVNNSGNDIFRILLRLDGALPRGWEGNLTVSEIDLSPGVPFTFRLDVTPPNGSRAGDLATIKVNAETDVGGNGGRIPGDEASAVVVVRRVHDLTTPAALDAPAQPGSTLRYVLPLHNAGNGNDAIELLPGAVSPAWTVRAEEATLTVPVNQTGELPLAIEVPKGAPPGLTNLTLTLRLSREAFQNVTIPLDVQPLALVTFEGVQPVRAAPGRPLRLDVVARNDGNLPGTFSLGARTPVGWDSGVRPAEVTLAPGETAPVAFVLNASRLAADGPHDVALLAMLGDAPAGSTPVPFTLARPALYLSDVSASGTLGRGDLVLVSAAVGNRGELAAENVSVALVVDGAVVDRALLSRVPVGAVVEATLSWVSTGSVDDVQVVLDPELDYVADEQQDARAEVVFGSRLPLPALPVVLVLIAALALATRRRRA